MKEITVLVMCLAICISCSKKGKKPFSYWKINGTEYSSNKTEVVVGPSIAYFSSEGRDRFEIAFNISGLSRADSLLLNTDVLIHDPGVVFLYFYTGTTAYGPPPPDQKRYLTSKVIEGKVQYTLGEMWYFNIDNPTDSVLVEGVFNEP